MGRRKHIRYVCPECGVRGAHPEELPAPKYHVCDYKVVMKPYNVLDELNDIDTTDRSFYEEC